MLNPCDLALALFVYGITGKLTRSRAVEARRVHAPKVAGSSPASAISNTGETPVKKSF